MNNLLPVTQDILALVEEKSGKTVEFVRDEKLPLLATLQLARHGAPFHVLRYRPGGGPIDYFVAYQAGFVLRLFENDPSHRFDFGPLPIANRRVEELISGSDELKPEDIDDLPPFAEAVAQWALVNLRSLPVGMRIDQWIATEHWELRDQQSEGISLLQQQNMDVLSVRRGRLEVPVSLFGPNAAYALFADRLLGAESFAVPYGAAGVLKEGRELLSIWDSTPKDPDHDCELVDRWATSTGMSHWYRWIPYAP